MWVHLVFEEVAYLLVLTSTLVSLQSEIKILTILDGVVLSVLAQNAQLILAIYFARLSGIDFYQIGHFGHMPKVFHFLVSKLRGPHQHGHTLPKNQ